MSVLCEVVDRCLSDIRTSIDDLKDCGDWVYEQHLDLLQQYAIEIFQYVAAERVRNEWPSEALQQW